LRKQWALADIDHVELWDEASWTLRSGSSRNAQPKMAAQFATTVKAMLCNQALA
jgi:hypothetical protein